MAETVSVQCPCCTCRFDTVAEDGVVSDNCPNCDTLVEEEIPAEVTKDE